MEAECLPRPRAGLVDLEAGASKAELTSGGDDDYDDDGDDARPGPAGARAASDALKAGPAARGAASIRLGAGLLTEGVGREGMKAGARALESVVPP
jgi:hypothetical protein